MAAVSGSGATHKVLIVDDDPGIRFTFSAFLNRRGYATAAAESGALALDMLSTEKLSAMLLDLRMPDLDGIGHTVLCETADDTRSWLPHVNYAEGVFLQEYLGRREVGHIALVSGGEVYPLVTDQEYKRSFAGNLGIIAGAPLGGLVEKDPQDKYGLARELIRPLRVSLRPNPGAAPPGRGDRQD